MRVIDYFGDDAAIVQAARVSYGKGTKKVSDDRNLIRYLLRHRHSTPFEMCEIKLHVKLPIFVARQWIRHRTANVNEYSARYSILDREFYVPVPGQLAAQSTVNRQGRGDLLQGAEAEKALSAIENLSAEAYRVYEELLNETRDGTTIVPGKPGSRARTRAHDAADELLHAMVLEGRSQQPSAFPVVARRCPCAIRNPRLCRRDLQRSSSAGARSRSRRSAITG